MVRIGGRVGGEGGRDEAAAADENAADGQEAETERHDGGDRGGIGICASDVKRKNAGAKLCLRCFRMD